jgi:hypothetical protein
LTAPSVVTAAATISLNARVADPETRLTTFGMEATEGSVQVDMKARTRYRYQPR